MDVLIETLIDFLDGNEFEEVVVRFTMNHYGIVKINEVTCFSAIIQLTWNKTDIIILKLGLSPFSKGKST